MTDFAARRTMLVDTQVRPNDVTKFPIIEAMLSVPREVFVPSGKEEAAYAGETLALGQGRYLLEARNFAKMLDAINIQPSDLVLDVASGLGYSTAVIARMAEAVVLLETAENAPLAEDNLAGQSVDNAVVCAGELASGAAKHGPYDAMVFELGLETLPAAYAEQLKEGGRVIGIFHEGALGVVRLGVKRGGEIVWRDVFNASAPVAPEFARARSFAL